jgi:hypothetical protein
MLVVIAIGARKSILFILLAAIISTSVTVVIALLNVLCNNLLDCCKRIGI